MLAKKDAGGRGCGRLPRLSVDFAFASVPTKRFATQRTGSHGSPTATFSAEFVCARNDEQGNAFPSGSDTIPNRKATMQRQLHKRRGQQTRVFAEASPSEDLQVF